MDVAGARAYSGITGGQGNASRERDPNCIEQTLKTIEVNLEEAINSAANLADKVRPEAKLPPPPPGQACPVGSDISSRLSAIESGIVVLNNHLGRTHGAISG